MSHDPARHGRIRRQGIESAENPQALTQEHLEHLPENGVIPVG